MNTSKQLILAAALVLLAGLGTGAAAQRKTVQKSLAPRLTTTEVNLKLHAVEVAGGTTGFNGGQTDVAMPVPITREILFGYSFLGRTSGELPGSFNLAMNCTPALFTPNGTNQMTGGTWTLPVYMDGPYMGTNYMGALYGDVTGGTLTWDKSGTVAAAYLTFAIQGGTQAMEGLPGHGTFKGTLIEGEKGSTLVGELTIIFE